MKRSLSFPSPSTHSHLHGGSLHGGEVEDAKTAPTPNSPRPPPLLPAELVLAILEEVTQDRTSLEEKHQTLAESRLVSRAFDTLVQTARPLLFHEVQLYASDLEAPSALLIQLLAESSLHTKGLRLAASLQSVNDIEPRLFEILTATSPISFACDASVSMRLARQLLRICFARWSELERLSLETWTILVAHLSSFPLLERLTVGAVSLTGPSAVTPVVALVSLEMSSNATHLMPAPDFRLLMTSSAPTLISLTLTLSSDDLQPVLSHLLHLRNLRITVCASADLEDMSELLLSIFDSCPPSLRSLRIHYPPRMYTSPILEQSDILFHLPLSLRQLTLHPFPALSVFYLHSHLQLGLRSTPRAPHLSHRQGGEPASFG